MRGRDDSDPKADRWSRSDWWGVVLEAPDPRELARFYSAVLGWPVHTEGDTWCTLDAGEGVAYLAFQKSEGYRRPTWPTTGEEQQMQLHLDFEVSDVEVATEEAVRLGAVLHDHQPQEEVRVLLDPAGHPFCLYAAGSG